MKRALAFILLIVCVLELFGCGNKDAMPQASDPVSEPIQNADTGNRNEEKSGRNKTLFPCSLV